MQTRRKPIEITETTNQKPDPGSEPACVVAPAAELRWILHNVYGYLEDVKDIELMERIDAFERKVFGD